MRLRALAVAVLLFASVAACSTGGDDPVGSPNDPVLPIRQQVIPSIANLPYLVAPAYAAQFGLSITSVNGRNVQGGATQALRGDLDVVSATTITTVQAADAGLPLVIVAGVGRGSTQLLSAAELGIRPGDWAALHRAVDDGVRSGTKLKWGTPVAGSANYVACHRSLTDHGIDPQTDLEIIGLQDFSTHAAAVQRGDVQLLCTADPFATMARLSGKATAFVAPDDTALGDQLGAMATTRAALQDPTRREALRRYLRLMQHVIDMFRRDPSVPEAKVAQLFGVSGDVARQYLAATYWSLPLTDSELRAMASAGFALRQTRADQSCCVPSFFDPSLLPT